MQPVAEFSISRCFFTESCAADRETVYQLHGFSDASNHALLCVIYLRRLTGGSCSVGFVQGKSKIVTVNQANWVISRKELEAARMCAALMLAVRDSLQHLGCSVHFWSDSQVVLKWILNPDLHLPRFVKGREDKICLVAPAEAWNYVNTRMNPADVDTCEDCVKKIDSRLLWFGGQEFLLRYDLEPNSPSVVVRRVCAKDDLMRENDAVRIVNERPLKNPSQLLFDSVEDGRVFCAVARLLVSVAVSEVQINTYTSAGMATSIEEKLDEVMADIKKMNNNFEKLIK